MVEHLSVKVPFSLYVRALINISSISLESLSKLSRASSSQYTRVFLCSYSTHGIFQLL